MKARSAFLVAGLGVAAAIVALHVHGRRPGAAPRAGAAGVSVELPRGWHQIAQAVPPPGMRTGDPVTRIVAASAPIGFDERGCNEFAYRFSRRAAGIVVLERVGRWPGFRFPGRPRRFDAATLPVRPPPALECWDGPGGGLEFTDHGRRLAAYVLLGTHAPERLADRARAVLDTLRVEPRR